MPSARDVCFAAAVDAYNELHEELHDKKWLDISHQTTWKKDFLAPGSRWFPAGLASTVTSSLKSLFGLASYQVRYPDMTINMPHDKYMILDNKFSGDRWGTTPGKVSGRTQKEDYKEINREQGYPMSDPKLDPQKCQCDERKRKKELQPQNVYVPVYNPALDPGLYFMPQPWNPNAIPGGVLRPAPVRPPLMPELVPIW
jgi:hypothetical protein